MKKDKTKPIVYVILGATAAGKSAAALAVAGRFGAEIISADSMQVYRGMDIGTAKPSPAERESVPHHLIDIRDPWESFSTAQYVELADNAVADITARGRLPLLVGGTALYIRSLLAGIFEGPSADWDFREEIRILADTIGIEALHARLAEVDAEAAARIHPNDLRRIERALEIHHKTGQKPSSLRNQWASADLRYDARIAGIFWPREILKNRIDERVDKMVSDGWLGEVEGLLGDTRGMSREASQALGYAQLARVVNGEIPLAEAVDEIKRKTRRFAKAQMTWFKSFHNVCWIDASLCADYGAVVNRLADCLKL